jgi:hypothetical protein
MEICISFFSKSDQDFQSDEIEINESEITATLIKESKKNCDTANQKYLKLQSKF